MNKRGKICLVIIFLSPFLMMSLINNFIFDNNLLNNSLFNMISPLVNDNNKNIKTSQIIENNTESPGDPVEYGTNVTIGIDITKPVNFHNVTISFDIFNKSGYFNMTQISGDSLGGHFEYNFTPSNYYYSLGLNPYIIVIGFNNGSYDLDGFQIYDVTIDGGPKLENLTKIDPLELGDKENITIDVTDMMSSISKVLIEINDTTNYTMNNIGANTYNYSWIPTSVGLKNYTIYANDTVNNWNSTSGSITVVVTGPRLENLTESADPLEFDDNETILIDAYDDRTSVSMVFIEISSTNHTMNNIGGNTYNYSWKPGSLGVIPYTIYANDTENRWNSTSGSITVVGIGPNYSNLVKTDPLNLTDNAEVWIDATDISGVSHVLIEFEGDGTNYTMTNVGGNTYYNDSFIPPTKGEFTFTIYMNDTNDNWTIVQDTIQVIEYTSTDLTDPIVFILEPLEDEFIADTIIKIGGIAFDSETNISAIYINDSRFTLTIDPRNSTLALYEYSNITYIATGYYSFTITVYDQGFNNATATVSFYVDFDTPSINFNITPQVWEAGFNRTINATVLDIDPNVIVILTYSILNNATEFNITMTKLAPTIYSCDVPAQMYGAIVFVKISAKDTIGRVSVTSWDNYSINDTVKPLGIKIFFSQMPFMILPGDFLIMFLSVQEETYGSLVDEVAIYYSTGLPFLKIKMFRGSSYYQTFMPKFEAGTVVLYYFNVTDFSGNSYISPMYLTVVVPEEIGPEILALIVAIIISAVIGICALLLSRKYEKEVKSDQIRKKSKLK